MPAFLYVRTEDFMKSTDKNKDNKVLMSLRISAEDKEQIEEKARKTGLTTSEYIRRCALGRKLPCYGDTSLLKEYSIEPVVEAIPIDFTKLTIEERAVFLPVPTDDIKAEYDAYCERMGYTAEKMNSIRYKMSLYDEFMEEYNYRERNYFKNENGKEISHKKDKGRGGITSNMKLR